ncbi:DNA-binding response regulator [Cellvibrio zantedeschiae]|uniref:DNA-binding response regulator n=1 Tax=Cellvibrio zantedeschiae TaxID=1237077 RepID=A0ABQ3AYZ5_9GAMM|nr:LytTR family DNA-binding domain-containing protein [Cellvibrio zantedeschiae]GGY70252.1 DNA-binding response regulator [Cellvibrio zantedeschiae]
MKAIVVEDSRLAREGLIKMLQEYPDIDIAGAADHPSTALVLIHEHEPDIIFLDIHMPGESGFDLLEKLDYSPKIIFTTAYSEYAIRSFDFNTIDYLLKPISHERLKLAIEKLSMHSEEYKTSPKPALDIHSRMFVKDGDKCHLVPLESIRYFESCKNHVRIFFGNDNAFVRKSLNSVEERLPKKYFFRANRQYVVNLNEVTKIEESISDGYEITMSDGKTLEISRRNAVELKDLLSF